MKKLMLSALALGAMTAVAMAGEPVQLTSSQLDVVTAGNPCSKFKGFCQINQSNWATQVAVADASFSFGGFAAAANNAEQENEVEGD